MLKRLKSPFIVKLRKQQKEEFWRAALTTVFVAASVVILIHLLFGIKVVEAY